MPKTQKTGASVADFVAAVTDERRRSDTEAALAVMRRVTGVEPAMWGPSIIGFGDRPHTTGKGCLYLKRFDDADPEVLAELVARAWRLGPTPIE